MEQSREAMLKACNAMCKNTLMETLEIEFVDITENTVVARMPVTPRVHQPDGVLHGGATVALAESVGSAASVLFLKEDGVQIRGIEIAANHVKSIKDGYVYATATIVHKGRTTQLWHIPVTNSNKELRSLVKLTTICLRK
jgi:uncharacterized protein (TIGR00369 family)